MLSLPTASARPFPLPWYSGGGPGWGQEAPISRGTRTLIVPRNASGGNNFDYNHAAINAPSPGTPEEGWGEGDFEHQLRSTFQITPSLPRSSGKRGTLLELLTLLVSSIIALGIAGCTIHPPGESDERTAASALGKPYEKPPEAREIPALPENPTADQLVQYALLNNADLEQRYWIWRSAVEQIPQDGSQTTTPNIAGGTTITDGRTNWRSSTLALGNDPMTDIKWPGKLDAAAREALENARAAGQRFLRAKYDLRGKVISAYDEYALNSQLIRLEQSNEQLLEITATTTAARSRTGSAGQQDTLKADNELDLSRNSIAQMRSQLPGQQALLNALLDRPPGAPCQRRPSDRRRARSHTRMKRLSSWLRNTTRSWPPSPMRSTVGPMGFAWRSSNISPISI